MVVETILHTRKKVLQKLTKIYLPKTWKS